MRIAVVSTPRSGNTWLRELLAAAYGLESLAVHHPTEIGPVLPERAVVQLHWDRTSDLVRYWEDNGFCVVTVARHPLDVLISMLHFARFNPSVARWLDGNYLDGLAGASPTGPAFARFAIGAGAGHLLGVTLQWWTSPDTLKVRYEDLSDAPVETLHALARRLDASPVKSFESALEACRLERFRAWSTRHGWRGQPGLWRRLMTADLARRIRHAHPCSFEVPGYPCNPDPALTATAAEAAWNELKEPE